jgi:hypothetical protein
MRFGPWIGEWPAMKRLKDSGQTPAAREAVLREAGRTLGILKEYRRIDAMCALELAAEKWLKGEIK